MLYRYLRARVWRGHAPSFIHLHGAWHAHAHTWGTRHVMETLVIVRRAVTRVVATSIVSTRDAKRGKVFFFFSLWPACNSIPNSRYWNWKINSDVSDSTRV